MQEQKQWITVEMGGTRKTILRDKLPEAQKMAEEMYALAIKAGYTEEMARKLYTLRIVKDGK